MTGSIERLQTVRRWVEKAEHDFINARHTLSTMGQDCPYDTVCFHAQQSAEKYIKAILIWMGTAVPPKIHQIETLADLLPQEMRPPLSRQEQETLSDHAVAARYVMDVEDPLEKEDAIEALGLAEKVRDSIRNNLPKEALEKENK